MVQTTSGDTNSFGVEGVYFAGRIQNLQKKVLFGQDFLVSRILYLVSRNSYAYPEQRRMDSKFELPKCQTSNLNNQ
jgi:hypothetical protein